MVASIDMNTYNKLNAKANTATVIAMSRLEQGKHCDGDIFA
jgi:hypothetical protein